jgi:hypothetical protein
VRQGGRERRKYEGQRRALAAYCGALFCARWSRALANVLNRAWAASPGGGVILREAIVGPVGRPVWCVPVRVGFPPSFVCVLVAFIRVWVWTDDCARCMVCGVLDASSDMTNTCP